MPPIEDYVNHVQAQERKATRVAEELASTLKASQDELSMVKTAEEVAG